MVSLNCPIPNNINPLSPTGFQLTITKLPNVTYFCQEANIPDMMLPNLDVGTPLSTIKIPGEILQYGDLNVTFMVDENMANYKAIYEWLTALGFPEDHNQYKDFMANQNTLNATELSKNLSDGSLQILDGSNSPVQTVNFIGLSPVSLGSLVFHSDVDDINYLIGQVSFRFTTFSFN